MDRTNFDTLKALWMSLGLPQELLQNHLRLTGDPQSALPSSFNLGLAAQVSVAAAALAAAHLHALSTGNMQSVTVNARHAALEFHSEAYYTINGTVPGDVWDDLAGTYPTSDGSFVRIHTNFPHHREGILSILKLPPSASRLTVTQALSRWNSKQFEEVAARNGMCATAMRSFEEWDKHPHAQAIRHIPPVQLIKCSDAPKRAVPNKGLKNGAMEGMRVLDLTRIIAGPVCGRTLAAHGADVLLVTSPRLPSLPGLDAETSRGKRTTQLDLTTAEDRDKLVSLAEKADVFLQGYRPGGLAEKGFGVAELARIRPGIVCANLTAWGWEGPWRNNRGFDSLVQTATGFNVDEAQAFDTFLNHEAETRGIHDITPRPFPVQALDHSAAYLLAFGVTTALCKTITEGGSWEVRVSLASVGNWVRSLGRLGPDGFKNAARPKRMYPPDEEIAALSTVLKIAKLRRNRKQNLDGESGQNKGHSGGTMLALAHSAILEWTPVNVTEAPVGLNVDEPCWLGPGVWTGV